MSAIFPPAPKRYGPLAAGFLAEDLAHRSARLPAFAVLAVYVLVLGSLFTGLPYLPSGLGELRGEGALPGFGLVMAFAFLTGVAFDLRGVRPLLLYTPLAVGVLASFVVNAPDISHAHFVGREGGEKFFSSLLVLGFYATGFYAMYGLATVYGVKLVLRHAGAAGVIAGAMLVAVTTLEIGGWFVAPLHTVWAAARQFWCFENFAAEGRLVGFAPEPSFGAVSALGVLGLLGCEIALRHGDGYGLRRSRTPLVLALLLFTFEMMANARTFLAGAGGLGLAALLTGPGRRLPPTLRGAILVLTPLAVQGAMIATIAASGSEHRTVSNITRTVGMLTAAELWSGHPVLGVGLGQYAFHFRSLVPSWGLQSWEISRYFRFDQYDLMGGLPPSFSLFTRLGAELGILGFVAWVLPALYAIRRAMLRAPGLISSVLICAVTAQIWTGLSLDSFRNTYYWIWLALLLAWPDQYQPEGGEAGPETTPAAPRRRLGRSWS